MNTDIMTGKGFEHVFINCTHVTLNRNVDVRLTVTSARQRLTEAYLLGVTPLNMPARVLGVQRRIVP